MMTEGEEVEHKEKLKSCGAQLAASVGAEHRVALIAANLVEHFEQRLAVLDGKALIVCMSRRIWSTSTMPSSPCARTGIAPMTTRAPSSSS